MLSLMDLHEKIDFILYLLGGDGEEEEDIES